MKIKNVLMTSTAAALLLSGATAMAAVHPVTGEELAADQTFTYSVIDESPSIDPGLVEDVSGSAVARDLFEGLLNQDAQGNTVPGVATGFTVSDDNMTYTFTLREDAKWSDGTPVTAGDFVYAWQRAADPATASPYAWYIELMSIENGSDVVAGEADPTTLGISAPDDYTVVVQLTQPLPYFSQMVTHATTFPVPRWAIEEHGSEWTRPENIVTNGAYILTEHVPQERMVRSKSDTYWNAENVIIEQTVSLVINDESQALTAWESGVADQVPMPTGQYPELKVEYPDEAIVFPRLCSYYYNFNMRDDAPEWQKDERVRQALSLAVDRETITEFVTASGQFPAYTFTPGATAGFEVPEVPAASMTQEERNAMAQALMADAGYGPDNPIELEILYNTSEGHKSIAIAISQMWKQTLGVETTLANMEWQTFLVERGNGNFDVSRAGWCGDYNEASTFLDLMDSGSGYNDAGYNSETVDALLAEAKTVADATSIYTQIEQIIAEEVPIIPIYHYTSAFMLSSDLKGWPVDNVEQNWYSRQLYKVAE